MNYLKLGFIAIFMFNFGHSEILCGKVTRVKDGDTVVAIVGTTDYTIRMAKIDAPEKTQDFGQESKHYLEDLVLDKEVSINVETMDKYRRTVAVLSRGSVTINYVMVREGYAWHYAKYDKSMDYKLAAMSAKIGRKGLWAFNGAEAPWDFRHNK